MLEYTYAPGTHDILRRIQKQSRGVFSFTIVPTSASGNFRRKVISITCDTYEQALNYLHRFTTTYYRKPKKLERFGNAQVVSISWQPEFSAETAVSVQPGTEITFNEMRDTLVEFVMSNAKRVVITRDRFVGYELL